MTESERVRWEKGDRVKESEEGRIGEIKRSTERERRRRTEEEDGAAQLLLQQGERTVIEGRAVATGIIAMCVAAAAANRT